VVPMHYIKHKRLFNETSGLIIEKENLTVVIFVRYDEFSVFITKEDVVFVEMILYGPYDSTYGSYAYTAIQNMKGGIFLKIDMKDDNWPLYLSY
jgi:hypothetical protein